MPYRDDGIGFQTTDTSEKAADGAARRVKTLRVRVLELLRGHPGGLDTEQISRILRVPYCSVQPRTSELRNEGLIFDSGRRNDGPWGKPIIVWCHAAFDHSKRGAA